VRDTGIGISKEGINRLFKSYSQAEASTARKYGGTGLGLAICQRLVGLMGGRIWVDSVIGQGSDFQFEIPLNPLGQSAPTQNPNPQLAGRRILIVEDNATYRQILAQEVQRWGVIALLAASADEALAILATEEPPEGAVIDLQLPGMDGRALITQIRRTHSEAQLPIIAVSLLIPGGQNEEGLGVARLIAKPVKLGVLRDALENLCTTVTQPQIKPPQQPTQAQGQQYPLRILLAEDLEVNQQVVRFMLQRFGYTCDVVADGQAAVSAVQTGGYDVVFMDMQMPIMDGVEATTRICQLHEKRRRPWVIAMTANALTEDREVCLAAGMDAYLSKPVSMHPLGQSLADAWGHLKVRRAS
jgi:CheY-like chemotaxis protein